MREQSGIKGAPIAASTALTSAFDVESFIHEYYDAWGGTDLDRIMSYYAENVVLQIPGLLMEGKKAVRDQFAVPFITAFPGNRHLVKNMIFGPGVVVVEFSFEAQQKGPFAGHAATGARISLPGCGVYEYDSATRQITAGRIYFDVGTLLQTITDALVGDRQKSEEALRTNERNLSLITNVIPPFIHVLRSDGSVLYANQAVLGYTGLTLEDVRKEDYRDRVFHPDDVERLREERAEALLRPVPFENEQRVLGKDGKFRWFLIRYNPLLDAEGKIDRWYLAAFDIEDRKQTEWLRAAEMRTLQMIADGASLNDILNHLCSSLDLFVSPSMTTILLMDRDGKRLWHTAGSRVPREWVPIISPLPVALEAGLCGTAAFLKTRIVVPDVATGPYWPDQLRPIAIRNGIRAGWSEPILSKDSQVLGTFALYSPEARIPSDADLALIEGAGRIALIAIERQRSQEALRNALDEIQKSESKLRQVIDTIPALAWCNLPDGPNEFLNKGWHEYTGLSVEQSHGWGWQTAFHPEDLPPLMEKWLKMLASGESDEIEARLRRHDGVYRWFLTRAEPFRDESGKIVRWYGTSTDIDDRKRAEALLAGEKRLLEMVASGCSLPDVLDALCRFVEDMAGRCYCSVYLIDPSGTKFHNAAAPSLPSSFNDPSEGAPVDCETGPCGMAAYLKTQVIASDIASDPRWPASVFRPLALAHGLRSCSSTPMLSLAGDVLGTFAIYQDEPASPTPLQQELIARATHIANIAIERTQGEAALKRSEAFLAEGQRLSRTGSFSWRVETGEITWSEEVYRMFQFEQGTLVTLELIGSRVHPEDQAKLHDMIERARKSVSDFEYEHRLLMPDPSVKYLHLIAHGMQDHEGRLEYIGAVQDVTESKVAEEAVRQTQAELAHVARLTTLGKLTASIAHEINQPLTAVVTNGAACLRWLQRDRPDLAEACAAVQRVVTAGQRAADTITRIRALAQNAPPHKDWLDLNATIHDVLALVRSEVHRHGVVVETQLAADVPRIRGDRIQLQQVLLNLLMNALEAMSGGGDGPRVLVVRSDPDAGPGVLVTVHDSGPGLDP